MRRQGDCYYTPISAVEALVGSLPFALAGRCLEPCAGTGQIVKGLKCFTYLNLLSNDIDRTQDHDFYYDIAQESSWQSLPQLDWVISNPPYKFAPTIVELSHKYAAKGAIFLLRLSFLEPCLNRQHFLQEHPPTGLISIPRISFTGDRRTDSVATSWIIWLKDPELLDKMADKIKIVPR